jgi:L-threonylcarbamoyladenylate synthase
MLVAHYAPRCQVLLAADADAAARLVAAHPGARTIDGDGDLAAYARGLYAWLRAADDDGVDTVVAVLPPPVGLGHAIRDRLTKAAAAHRPRAS